ncbi:MAG: DUF3822 family protein [Mangrovibacterium sp.]
MQRLSLVDEDFDLKQSKDFYIMSIQLSLDGFSFSVLDSRSRKVICLYHQDTFTLEPEFYLKKLRSIYEEADLLQIPYKKTNIFLSLPGKTTLVPLSLFREEMAETFFRLTTERSRTGKIMYTLIPDMISCAVYELDQGIYDLLQKKHPGSHIQHDLLLSSRGYLPAHPLLKIRILRKQMEILSLHDGINFYNTYDWEHETDQLYYILGTVKNLGLKPGNILLDGMVNSRETIYQRLKAYFPKLALNRNNPVLQYSSLLERLPDARFTNLFNSFSPGLLSGNSA